MDRSGRRIFGLKQAWRGLVVLLFSMAASLAAPAQAHTDPLNLDPAISEFLQKIGSENRIP